MAATCTMEDMYKNFQILADAKEKAGEVTICALFMRVLSRPVGRSVIARLPLPTVCRWGYYN